MHCPDLTTGIEILSNISTLPDSASVEAHDLQGLKNSNNNIVLQLKKGGKGRETR